MRLSPIISLYVARNFALAFLFTLLGIIGVTLLFDSIELLRRMNGEGGLGVVLEMAVLKMPQMLATVLPFAVMLGAMIAFWRLTRTNELVVIRAVGVSAWQFLAPVLIVVTLFGAFNLAVLNPVGAAMYREYERMEDALKMRGDNPLSFSSGGGLWMREATPQGGQAVIHADGVRQRGGELTMRGVSVLSLGSDGRLIGRYEAEEGAIHDRTLLLADVWILKAGEPSRHAAELRQPTTLTLGKIQEKFSSPASLSFWELPGFIKFFESAGFSAHRHLLAWHALLASPLLLVAMVFVAAVFSLNPNVRKGGLLARVVAGVGVGFGFYFFTRVTYALGISSSLPVFLAAWSPVVVTLLISLAVVFHQEDG
ncbi:putative permease [uncultured Alphaproteobacteria bacterium]|uniref:Putative permease n=1 Tax=uncultured Alphaproteobacteria bacterium TaxID=91750 RepID=A0A212JTH6_9PROT|nr:putative permease [uncultured Alphaproteobacteria bacterium]